MRKYMIRIALVLMLALVPGVPAVQAEPNDQDALAGITTGKALYDINISDKEPAKLMLYLSVISETYQGMLKQNVAPDFIVAFRGLSVKLVTSDYGTVGAKEREARDAIAFLISQLQAGGVKFEACSVATRLFKVDNNSLLPGIKPVGNTFISLTGYQSKGYALIPIM